MNINSISPEKNKYLQILSTIHKVPKRLYYIGMLPEERRVSLAIVGTRKPSSYGREVTTRFASECAQKGVVIVSGLALGVDAIAHASALDAGGTTIAILGNGLPDILPATNRNLGERIVKGGGAVLSEYEPGSSVRAYHFLERNRLVAGLSDAILITEAAARSGTLNTAAHALEQGKDVFVIPGNITSPLSSGCNQLLRAGAIPAITPDDILSVIAPSRKSDTIPLALAATDEEVTILKLLIAGVRDGDELQIKSHLSPATFSSSLTMLEINGQVRSLGANQWAPV